LQTIADQSDQDDSDFEIETTSREGIGLVTSRMRFEELHSQYLYEKFLDESHLFSLLLASFVHYVIGEFPSRADQTLPTSPI
jgi:hypothetical protein